MPIQIQIQTQMQIQYSHKYKYKLMEPTQIQLSHTFVNSSHTIAVETMIEDHHHHEKTCKNLLLWIPWQKYAHCGCHPTHAVSVQTPSLSPSAANPSPLCPFSRAEVISTGWCPEGGARPLKTMVSYRLDFAVLIPTVWVRIDPCWGWK